MEAVPQAPGPRRRSGGRRVGVGAGLGDGSHLKIDIVLSSADCRFGLAADLVPVALVPKRVSRFYHERGLVAVRDYILARTVPRPDTQHPTPLAPDWHVLKPKNHTECGRNRTFALPFVDKKKGSWRVEIRQSRDQRRRGEPSPQANLWRWQRRLALTDLQIPVGYINWDRGEPRSFG